MMAFTRLFLLVAGIIAMALGTMILLMPTPYYAGYGMDVAGQVNLLNELRAPGLGLAAAGLFIASGAARWGNAAVATVIATGLYLSYGLSRLVAITFDGLPSSGLVLAAAVEIGLGLVGLVLLRARSASAAA